MRRLLLHFTALVLLAFQVNSASHYVLDGGSGDGSSWSSAWDVLPTTLTRGDTYYIGDGTYAAYDFDTATSGTTMITVKKATASDHGTDTGWSSTYGDGTATFSGSTISTGYWLIDGASRSSISTGHGIRFETGAAVNPSAKGLRITGQSNITIRYVALIGHGPDGDGGGNDLLYSSSPSSNITIQYCLFYDAGRTHLLTRGGSGWLLEHNYFWKCESDGLEHSESWSPGTTSDVVYRYNRVEDQEGTGILCTLDNAPGPDNWEIYGNVFVNNQASTGAICTDSESTWTNVKIYNNTFVGGSGDMGLGVRYPTGSSSTWDARNNLWYNPPAISLHGDSGAPVHDYNWFYPSIGTGGDLGESNGQVGSGDPFTSSGTGDYTLAANTTAGANLGSPYNVDMLGNARTTWSRGAYEYDGTPPEPDTTPPVISSVSADPSTTSATVTWATDEAATSGLQWGLTTSYTGSSTNSSTVTSHSLSATSLSASTTYHYRVISSDAAGNTTVGDDGTFTTSATPASYTYSIGTLRINTLRKP